MKERKRIRKKNNRTETRKTEKWKQGTIRREREKKTVEVTSSALSDACSW